MSGMAAFTVSTGSVLGTSACLFALSSTSQAAQYGDETVTLEEDAADGVYEFTNTAGQTATVSGTRAGNELKIAAGVGLTLSGDASARLNVGTLTMANNSTLTLTAKDLLNLTEMDFATGAGSRIIANFSSPALNMHDFISESYTGAFEIRNSHFVLNPADQYNFSELKVVGNSARLYLNEAATYTINNLHLSGGSSNQDGVLQLVPGSRLNANIVLDGNTIIRPQGRSEPIIIDGTITGNNNIFFVWGNSGQEVTHLYGTITGVTQLITANSGNVHVYAEFSASQNDGVLVDGRHQLKTDRGGAANPGTVNYYNISGFSDFHVQDNSTVNIWNDYEAVDGTSEAEQGFIMMRQEGNLHFKGKITNLARIWLNHNGNRFYIDGDVEGKGDTIQIAGARGSLYLTGDITWEGKLALSSTGNIYFGESTSSQNSLNFSEIEVNTNATFCILHAAGDNRQTNIVMNGGTLYMDSMNAEDAPLTFGSLIFGTETANIQFSANNGGIGFATLTGAGNISVSKSEGVGNNGTSKSSLVFEQVNNYSGTVSWAASVTDTAKEYQAIKISDVHQDAGYEATFATLVESTAFHKTGEGTLTLEKGISASGDFWMVYEGTLNVAESVYLADNTVLHYGEGTAFDYLDTPGRLQLEGLNTRLFINTEDLDLAALLSTGIDLHLSSRDIVRSRIFALGLTADEYTLEENPETGTWWITASTAPHAGDKSTDGVWDARWDEELRLRPISGSIPKYSTDDYEATGAYLAGDNTYIGRTTEGEVYWAKFGNGSTGYGADIVCGAKNTNRGAYANKVEANVWISIEGGYFYYNIIGGNDDSVWAGQSRLDFEGSSHIIINPTDHLDIGNIIGGNWGDGPGSGNGNSYIGDSYISVMGDTTVWGSIVGGTVSFHGGNPTDFTGNSHLFIYNVQQETLAQYPTNPGDEEPTPPFMPQAIIGGNLHIKNLGDVFFNGNSSIYIDTANAYSAEGAEFSKQIIAGDAAIVSDWRPCSIQRTGNTELTITRAAGVTFTKDVIGGSYDLNGWTATIEGDTSVTITSGIYNGIITGGSYRATITGADGSELSIDGNTSLTLSGGTFNGRDAMLPPPPVIEDEDDEENLGEGDDGDNAGADDGPSLPDAPITPPEPEELPNTLGAIAVVGGNLIVDTTEEDATERNQTVRNEVSGSSTITINSGSFNGHVVGASVVQAHGGKLGTSIHGDTTITMKGGSVNGDSRIVGGLLLDVPTSFALPGSEISLGKVSITIGGSARVKDVIGGSWVNGVNVGSIVVEQGEVEIHLADNATIRGDVYAGGIQGGSIGMSTESVTVSIDSGVTFSKTEGDTIVSAGYLSLKEDEADSAYGSHYTKAGTVTGERVLNLTDANYGEQLAHVQLLNFDTVNLGEGTTVKVRALTVIDSERDITVTGGGTIILDAALLSDVPDAATGGTKNVRSNSSMVLTEGSSLYITNSSAANHLSFVDNIVASDGSHITIDLALPEGGNDTLQVLHSIVMQGSSELTLNFNCTASMEKFPLICAQNTIALPDEHGQGPVLQLDNTRLHLNISYLDSDLLTGKQVRLVVAESVTGNFVGDDNLNQNLQKWFTGDAEAIIEELGSDIRQLVLRGTTVSSETADYHSSKAITANGYEGARMLDNLYTTLNPEATDPHGDRASLLNALEVMMANRDFEGADRAMAAAAGSALPALSMALSDDVDRQLRAIRNRTTTTGLDADYDYGELPKMNFWLNAEGDFHKVKAESTAAGYKMNSWGGTVGMGAETSEHTSVGLALTAMYGSLTIDAPDSTSGHLMTAYLSGYVRHNRGSWTHTLVGTVGLANANVTRTVDYGTGRYTPKADANGYAVGVMYEVGYSIMLNENGTACAQPVVNITWSHAELGSFTESGSDAGLEVDGLKRDNLAVGAGARLQALVGGEIYNRTSILEGRVLLKSYFGDRDASAKVNFQGAQRTGTVRSVETGAVGVEIGAGLTVPMNTENPSSIFMDVSAELRDAYTNFNATIGWKTSF